MNITGMHVEGIPFPGIKVTGSNVARTIVTTKLTRGTISTRIHVATLEAGSGDVRQIMNLMTFLMIQIILWMERPQKCAM